MEDEGLRGTCCGTGGIEAVKFVLELDDVAGRLGAKCSGLFEDEIGGGGADEDAEGDTG